MIEMTPEEEAYRDRRVRELVGKAKRESAEWWAQARLEQARLLGPNGDEPIFLGQKALKAQVEPFFSAAKFPHTLLTGVPGSGKTEMARWIAYKRNAYFEELLAPVTAAAIPQEGVVLLDEAHRQKQPEPLFGVMMDDNVTVTIIAATTRPELLDSAFKSRFFLQLHISKYSQEDMELIIQHLATDEIPTDSVSMFARASAGNPRQANRIMETANLIGSYDPVTVLSTCRITADGLTEGQHDYLAALKRGGKPMGLTNLALLVGRDETTVREMEPYLVELGLVEFTSSGRTLTALGRRYA